MMFNIGKYSLNSNFVDFLQVIGQTYKIKSFAGHRYFETLIIKPIKTFKTLK